MHESASLADGETPLPPLPPERRGFRRVLWDVLLRALEGAIAFGPVRSVLRWMYLTTLRIVWARHRRREER